MSAISKFSIQFLIQLLLNTQTKIHFNLYTFDMLCSKGCKDQANLLLNKKIKKSMQVLSKTYKNSISLRHFLF